MSGKKLFLLDGMALVYRAFFAFNQNPRITSTGINASAMFGFTNTLLEILRKHNPTHIAVVFDTDKPTQRHIEFEKYKAHREEMPEDLRKSLPYIVSIIQAFNISVLSMDGYEADDIIGTLAWQAPTDMEVFMMTPDKDFGQLVRDNVKIYKPGRMGNPDEILGIQEILEKWEIVRIDQVIDILGLWGDAADNIPGVPGVGEKTAKKLIQEYDNMENILAHTHELKGKMKEKFEEFAEQARVSKRLATIDTQVPISIEIDSLILKPVNEVAITEIFNQLEFRTLLKRVLGQSSNQEVKAEVHKTSSATKPQSNPAQTSLFDLPQHSSDDEIEIAPIQYKTIIDVPHDYQLVSDEESLKILCQNLLQKAQFSFDTETTDLDITKAKLVGASFSWEKGQGVYISFPQDEINTQNWIKLLSPVFNSSALKVAQNLKFDMAMYKKYGVEIKPPYFDTMLSHYLVEPDQRHNMEHLSQSYLGYNPISIEHLIGKKGKNQGTMADVDVAVLVDYASEDTDVTLQLKEILAPEIENRNLSNVFHNIEMPLVSVLMEMEEEGVKIDTDFLKQYSKDLLQQAVSIQSKIFELAGSQFNISSPQQVGVILFEHLKLSDKPKKTKTGQYQTDEETLLSLKGKHEIIDAILNFRALQKLKSTYVDALPLLVKSVTGRVHTSFNQAVAATGRLSSQNPNLQNIPIRTELGREIRKAFIPRDENHQLLSADYSQIELRIIAHISKDQGMMEAFKAGHDIHTATAAKVWGVELSDVDKEMRRKAKTVNFGIIYGISAFGLSQRVNIPRAEAKSIIDNYFEQFPGIKQYMDETIQFARDNGYVETITGRRRNLRDINSRNATVRGFAERNAINAPIQGSAADMIKIAMINIQKWLKSEQLNTKMILQVHDELLFDVPTGEMEIVREKVKEIMENAMNLDVPILVETGIGNNWLEAH